MNANVSKNTKKKLLVISPFFPYPLNEGGKIGIFNLIKHLSRFYEIYLVSFIEKEYLKQSSYAPVVKYCRSVDTVIRENGIDIRNKHWPLCINNYLCPEMEKMISGVVKKIKPDLVNIHMCLMAQYVSCLGGTKAVLTDHDTSSLDFNRSCYSRELPEDIRFIEWYKHKRFVRDVYPGFDSLQVLTERDKRTLVDEKAGFKPVVIPVGVDLASYRPVNTGGYGASRRLLFVGSGCLHPNMEGIDHFIRNILPDIKKSIPSVKLDIIGSGLQRSFDSDYIRKLGEVKNIRKFFKQATVFVVPVRLGGGIKSKILAAMAFGLPVISTKEASIGIGCKDGENILIAKNVSDFAKKTIILLNNRNLRLRIAKNARFLIERNYNWVTIAEEYRKYFNSLIYQYEYD